VPSHCDREARKPKYLRCKSNGVVVITVEPGVEAAGATAVPEEEGTPAKGMVSKGGRAKERKESGGSMPCASRGVGKVGLDEGRQGEYSCGKSQVQQRGTLPFSPVGSKEELPRKRGAVLYVGEELRAAKEENNDRSTVKAVVP